jgi:hypothetical protein
MPGSPLASHLPPGTLLTALDDFPLSNTQENTWSDYLTGPHSLVSKEPALCLDTEWFHSGELLCGTICFSLMTYCTQITRMVVVQPHRPDPAPKHA